jgi:hypothetical protein
MFSGLPALVLAAISQDSAPAPGVLRAGAAWKAEITDAAPEVLTPALERRLGDVPVVGESITVEIVEPGPYTLELRSYLFDAYLVLRDSTGELLAEDDDGLIGTQARIVATLTPGLMRVDVCALHGERGSFELTLESGTPVELSAAERARAHRAELERVVAVREEALGPEHPDTASSLDLLAELLYSRGDLAEARALYERVLSIREKALGPDDAITAKSLNDLALLCRALGDHAVAGARRRLRPRRLLGRRAAPSQHGRDTGVLSPRSASRTHGRAPWRSAPGAERAARAGRAPLDWVAGQEPLQMPPFLALPEAAGVSAGTRPCDLGGGGGTASVAAAGRGARVTGLDACAPLIEVARERR